jgi:hypothetical protein
MTEQPSFVQFPHPGPERKVAEGQDRLEWSRGDHTRKFLKANGTYVTTDDQVADGPVAFWGEWEPPSRVIHAFAPAGGGEPRWLHEPYWRFPGPEAGLNDTDPLVFGDHFTYSNCRQPNQHNLHDLEEGSLILLGSGRKNGSEWGFILDTVLVTGGPPGDYTPASGIPDCQPVVQGVVLDPLRADPGWSGFKFARYRGRTFREAHQGPFSFVPCKPCDDLTGCAFARPVIELEEPPTAPDSPWLRPSAVMVARCQHADPDRLQRIWSEVVEQVRGQGLALGVRLEVPEEIGVTAVAESAPAQPRLTRSGCSTMPAIN